MDPLVEAALRKWPNVPHCYGWLALDARGDWYLRDEQVRRAGAFPQVKGSRIRHQRLCEFMARNYAGDAAGCWFFQNGPQRVYVELEAAPFVWRLHEPGGVLAPDGRRAGVTQSCTDEAGRLFLATDIGFGIVHTLDMLSAANAVERGEWTPTPMPFDAMPARFGYVLKPAPAVEAQEGA